MSPEAQILTINAVCLAVGYGFILPAQLQRGPGALALADAGVGLCALITAGALFWGTGQGFRLPGFEVNWFVFALVTLVAMELPLAWWLLRRYRWPPGDGEG